jgi:hypothetical protein
VETDFSLPFKGSTVSNNYEKFGKNVTMFLLNKAVIRYHKELQQLKLLRQVLQHATARYLWQTSFTLLFPRLYNNVHIPVPPELMQTPLQERQQAA